LRIFTRKNPYKGRFTRVFMASYEQMLDEAYKSVVRTEVAERFEIPNVKGHHMGVRTVIDNFGQIANHIRRETGHFAKALGRSLASSADVQGDKLTLSRKLSSKDVNVKIEDYVKEFVLCNKCKKPDTELIEEGGKSFIHCLACGEKREVHKI
jgi:translation initiation factor 2 subunit 2